MSGEISRSLSPWVSRIIWMATNALNSVSRVRRETWLDDDDDQELWNDEIAIFLSLKKRINLPKWLSG